MCGISGIINFKGVSERDVHNINKMVSVQYHRGPDFNQIKQLSENVIFGHNRLSIIDLNKRANQPMKIANGKYSIVLNGEIYNFKSIRNNLEKVGIEFKTTSDTEVVLRAYERWGTKCLQQFNGMFSFAIYDRYQNILLFARDRAGKKPLYYYHDNRRFIFASEIKAILQNDVSRDIDTESLNYYFTFGYIPYTYSIFKKVKKLPAAHYAILNLNRRTYEINQYWHIQRINGDTINNENEALEQLQNLLEDSTRLRLISDVPVGAFLSGGIDSSVISYLASKNISQLKTFSIGFNDKTSNELPFSRHVARIIGSDHNEFIVDINETKKIFDELIFEYDEPFADSSMIPTYWVSKLAKQEATVALSGDAGDELFGGYNHYDIKRYGISKKVPTVLGKVLSLNSLFLPEGTKGKNFLYGLRYNTKNNFTFSNTIFKIFERKQYFRHNIFDLNSPEAYKTSFMKFDDDILNFTYSDFMTYLCDDILVKVDRASMINSLEVRVPLLDYRLIEFSFNKIGSEFKIVNNTQKYLMKKLALHLLGRTYYDMNRSRKQGFSIKNVLSKWFDPNEWLSREYLELLNTMKDDFLCKKPLLKLLDKYHASNGTHLRQILSSKLFLVYMYFKWKQKWL